jgi:hypothetical protein
MQASDDPVSLRPGTASVQDNAKRKDAHTSGIKVKELLDILRSDFQK